MVKKSIDFDSFNSEPLDSNEGLIEDDQSVNQEMDFILLQLLLMLPSAQHTEADLILSKLEPLRYSEKHNLLVHN